MKGLETERDVLYSDFVRDFRERKEGEREKFYFSGRNFERETEGIACSRIKIQLTLMK